MTSPTRYTVYYALVQIAGQVDQIRSVFTDLDKMRAQLSPCNPNNEQMQKLLQILHETLLNCRERYDYFEILLCQCDTSCLQIS